MAQRGSMGEKLTHFKLSTFSVAPFFCSGLLAKGGEKKSFPTSKHSNPLSRNPPACNKTGSGCVIWFSMSGHQIGRFPPCFLVNYNCLISLWSSSLFSDWLLVTVRWQACLEGVTAGCPAHEGRLHGNFDGLPLVHIKREISEEKCFGSI